MYTPKNFAKLIYDFRLHRTICPGEEFFVTVKEDEFYQFLSDYLIFYTGGMGTVDLARPTILDRLLHKVFKKPLPTHIIEFPAMNPNELSRITQQAFENKQIPIDGYLVPVRFEVNT